MEKNLTVLFMGRYSDLQSAMKNSTASMQYKSVYLADNKPLDNKNIKICSESEVILEDVSESTLLIASNLSSYRNVIYKALEKKCHLFLLSHQDITIKEYSILEEYSKNRGVAFYVPIFAYSKAILLKKMINLYTKDRILNITINDQDNAIFNSNIFLLILNIINAKSIKNIKIEQNGDKIKIKTDKYIIEFKNNSREQTIVKAITDDDIWKFTWNASDLLETSHKSGMKERYFYEEKSAVENIYKNIYSHCLGISPMLYTTIEDMLVYLKIKSAFFNMTDDNSINISI